MDPKRSKRTVRVLRIEARAAVRDAYRSVVKIARTWQRHEGRGDARPLGYESLEHCLEVQLAAAGAVAAFLLAPPADAAWTARMRDDPGTLVVVGPPDSLAQVAAQVRAPVATGDVPHSFFIIDPRAQPVLHYAADVDYKDVLKDLQRLVKYVDLQ